MIIIVIIMATFFAAGIISGSCGVRSIRLRPALIFQEHHANIFLDHLGEIIKGL